MLKKLVVIMLVLLSFIYNHTVFAENSSDFKVKSSGISFYIDDNLVNNNNLDFPLVSYKNIIYLPLSYNSSKSFGLSLKWNNEKKTLSLDSSNVIDIKKFSCNNILDIRKSKFNVEIKDEKINSNDYPNLLINNLIYIPLIYDNIKKFGWTSSWDNVYGLKIYTKNYEKLDKKIIKDDSKEKEIEFMRKINKNLSYDEAKNILELIYKANNDYGIDVHWIMSMMWLESNYDKDCVYKNAVGLMQMLIATARTMDITKEELHNPAISIDSGVKYLKNDLEHYKGNLDLATLAYNQGSVRVDKGTYKTWYLENIKKKFKTINEYVN
ncbi:lytic transglycosylase domain-containing protein [Helicovermis profundi]|uniref:Transglycosylase SLT domain-containing protein n=1 Tax=Helicovermis profundi TaxID=3065157 RepID=A0AAU9ETL1_9FIRM|nr:hypothetical protein HLPR_21160 [Clostridia bacterium S502]